MGIFVTAIYLLPSHLLMLIPSEAPLKSFGETELTSGAAPVQRLATPTLLEFTPPPTVSPWGS